MKVGFAEMPGVPGGVGLCVFGDDGKIVPQLLHVSMSNGVDKWPVVTITLRIDGHDHQFEGVQQ